ncbi:hypothetical protein [Candidatus Venteria ishoeyi]|uniref:Uncharacterized protein n=1 Tax=Candidatus Venteria ishoeyi TaxID=1899563 RepID=A0A1H6F8A0_9GAMM|nr:hypothetical protein [Candidatus Venteria ishoeyi]SEH06352.1 Uncharacterised protein [Candidatus Venteria ishoeyi]
MTPTPTRLQLYRQELPRLIEQLRRNDFKLGIAQHIDAQQLLGQLAGQDGLPRHKLDSQKFSLT